MPSLRLDPLTPQAGHVSALVITPPLLSPIPGQQDTLREEADAEEGPG